MKKIATNTLATMVRVSSLAIDKVDTTYKSFTGDQRLSTLRRLERIYRRHDRKFEIRAALLGMQAAELRQQLRRGSLEKIVRRHGFRDLLAFYIALAGKLKDELRRRGWSDKKVQEFIEKRVARLSDSMPKVLAPAV